MSLLIASTPVLIQLNDLKAWATDIGNAYLEANTLEKVVIEAGPEIGDLEGHMLVIVKALYGLRTSRLHWHERFAECLHGMGFFPCKAEPDIWMSCVDNIYEYIVVYVNDLALALKNPAEILNTFETKYGFKLKGSGLITFHLGCDFYHDEHGMLCMEPKKYIKKMVGTYE
jgi:hypothetical protein